MGFEHIDIGLGEMIKPIIKDNANVFEAFKGGAHRIDGKAKRDTDAAAGGTPVIEKVMREGEEKKCACVRALEMMTIVEKE
jgi:hypothetical protein